MPYVEVGENVIDVTTAWTDAELVKTIPGSRWDGTRKIWTVPLTWAACLQLRGVFGQALEVGPGLAEWSMNDYTTRVEPAMRLRTDVTRSSDAGFDQRLYDFQTSGAEFLRVARCALLGDDLGMGKTAQVLANLAALERHGETPFPALVICPNGVKPGWVNQLDLWKIDANPYVVTGSAAQRKKIIESARSDPRAIVIINIEAVRLLSRLAPYGSVALRRCRGCDRHGEENLSEARCEVHAKPLNRFGFRSVILDEAHRIKEPSSKQTRAVWAVAHDSSVEFRVAMTGTPVANHVGDLWSIMHFLVPREFPTRGKFIDTYGLLSWNGFGGADLVGIKPDRRDEFYRIIDPRFRRTPKALVLTQLPRVVRVQRHVEMTPKQEKAYRELESSFITTMDNGEVLITPDNLMNALRLLQLSSSYCDVRWVPDPQPDDPEHMRAEVTLTEPSPKLDAMEEEYEALGGEQVVVVAESRQLIELAARRFKKNKIPYGLIVGGMSDVERWESIQNFKSGHSRAMLMTIKAGGTGIDGLQVASTMFALQRSWSMVDNVQVDGRVDRIGSERHKSVVIVDFVALNTIEERVQIPRLLQKYERLEEINRDRLRLGEAARVSLDQRETTIINSSLGVPSE